MILNKAQILVELKLKTEMVEFGAGSVIVSELSAADYFSLYEEMTDDGKIDTVQFSRALVARCVVDEDGKQIFEPEEAALLHRGSFATFEKLSSAARRLNGLDAAAKGVEKN